jgi:cytoskeletal protein CcmA (bactofilin family)
MDHKKSTDVLPEPSEKLLHEKTIIANSFTVEGELEAKEDTLIQGRVEGSILAEDYTVRIGKTGHVKGEVFAKAIIAEGTTEGQLSAKEKIVLRQTAEVKGKILAPQVGMEEGCQFDGEVKMGAAATAVASTRTRKRQRNRN